MRKMRPRRTKWSKEARTFCIAENGMITYSGYVVKNMKSAKNVHEPKRCRGREAHALISKSIYHDESM